jgi:hypothetical protein
VYALHRHCLVGEPERLLCVWVNCEQINSGLNPVGSLPAGAQSCVGCVAMTADALDACVKVFLALSDPCPIRVDERL